MEGLLWESGLKREVPVKMAEEERISVSLDSGWAWWGEHSLRTFRRVVWCTMIAHPTGCRHEV
jgi:hypothetical protein